MITSLYKLCYCILISSKRNDCSKFGLVFFPTFICPRTYYTLDTMVAQGSKHCCFSIIFIFISRKKFCIHLSVLLIIVIQCQNQRLVWFGEIKWQKKVSNITLMKITCKYFSSKHRKHSWGMKQDNLDCHVKCSEWMEFHKPPTPPPKKRNSISCLVSMGQITREHNWNF